MPTRTGLARAQDGHCWTHHGRLPAHPGICCFPRLWSCSPDRLSVTLVALSPLDLRPCGTRAGDVPAVTVPGVRAVLPTPLQRPRPWHHGSPFPEHSLVAPLLSGWYGLAWGDNWGWLPRHRDQATILCLSFPSSHAYPPSNTFPLPPHWGGFSKKQFVRGILFFFLKEIKYFIFIYIYVLQNAPHVPEQEGGVVAPDFPP